MAFHFFINYKYVYCFKLTIIFYSIYKSDMVNIKHMRIPIIDYLAKPEIIACM